MRIKYVCPNCKSELNLLNKSFICKNNHSFDIAKEGYVNLLLANSKKKKDPGDNDIMIKAREEFLNTGCFNQLIMELSKIIKSFNIENINLLDAGCGTGYYSRKIKELNNNINLCGVDISKHAIKLASKKDKTSAYAVASIFDLPFENNSFDVILNVFAPKPQNEFLRVLKKDGYVLEVIPAKNHLLELRELLFENQKGENKQVKEFESFNLYLTQNLTYNAFINGNENILNLLKMTPYFYKTNPQKISNLNNINSLNITLDFTIKVWKKANNF